MWPISGCGSLKSVILSCFVLFSLRFVSCLVLLLLVVRPLLPTSIIATIDISTIV